MDPLLEAALNFGAVTAPAVLACAILLPVLRRGADTRIDYRRLMRSLERGSDRDS
jgi:hypothetical protein